MNTTAGYKNRHNYWKMLAAWVLLAVMIVSAAIPAAAAYPKKDGNVADEAGVLAENTIRTIQKTNETMQNDFGVCIALCTVKTTGDTPIDQYARGLFKSWNLGDGVLIVIAVDDEDYYFVQSDKIEHLITNEVLADVRDNYFHDDFVAGNIDRGVIKTVSDLSGELVKRIKESAKAEAEAQEKAEQEKAEEEAKEDGEGTTVGSVIVGFFKFLLVIALILALATGVLFVGALFDTTCARIFVAIFCREDKKKAPAYEYDDRLYGPREGSQQNRRSRDPYAQNRQILDQRRGNPSYQPHRTPYGGQADPYAQPQRQNPQRRPQNGNYQNRPNGALPSGNNGYRNNSYSGERTYYSADGRPVQQNRPQNRNYQNPQQNRSSQYTQQAAQQNRNPQYGQPRNAQRDPYAQRGQRPAQQRYRQTEEDDGATRSFTIPGRGNY